ncbi:peroxiredoxin [Mycoplasma struthionis]|uniref:Peroxiredoxin n=1 Tax=Mycoplasma struthionis TaxID=538220 RepID=A0A3G8LH80_9MOLU|nr:peroxiredoxin [Mycoplasma struthionis]AZG68704.1 peroxiredoxin [Mycoplasma struthionis]TPI01955.1 peroxiredoxin [Mycoplasma struthionis]
MSQLINKEFPQFELVSFYENKINRSFKNDDLKGKWTVLCYYPADFSGVCPFELIELQQNYEEFRKEGAQILVVSNDSVYTHKAWHDFDKEINKVEYPMLADKNAKLSKELGIYIEEKGISYRASYIINPEGIIKALEVSDTPIIRDSFELIRKLRAAKYVSENHNACLNNNLIRVKNNA